MGNESGKHHISDGHSHDKKGSPRTEKKKGKHDHKEHRKSAPTPASTAEAKGYDVMISHSLNNLEQATRLKAALKPANVEAFVQEASVAAGGDFLKKVGQAIIDAKVFIPILSVDYVNNKFCRDELALAYVSDKVILPVTLVKPDDLFPSMDMGMKLQLARFDWLPFEKEHLENLVSKIKAALSQKGDPKHTKVSTGRTNLRSAAQAQFTRQKSVFSSQEQADFWAQNFKDRTIVPWASFSTAFREAYGSQLERIILHDNEIDWIMDVLKHELEVQENGDLSKKNFDDFLTVDGARTSLWTRVEDQVTEAYAIREVFNVDSSVRVEAIENLSKFRSAAVVEALLDLLADKDKNVRTVAAISLARTESSDRLAVRRLMRCLMDEDRLVREAGCLALGHLKAKEAVPKIASLWRNDTISSVREAAAVALEQIGGEEAQKAMHVTRVLQEEIRRLNQMT